MIGFTSLSKLIRIIEDSIILIETKYAEDAPMLIDFLQIYTEILSEFLRQIST